jgi:GntR family transcriptional regulator
MQMAPATLSVDRDEVLPLYYQIRQKLLDEIVSGKFRAGAPLPSEQEIARQAGVSRMTARQALKALCQMGVTYSVRGRGTFASGIKLVKDFRQVQSFTEEMQTRGLEPRSRLLSLKAVQPPEEVSLALRLGPKQRVIRLSRLRLANGSPMGVETSHLPEELCPDLPAHFKSGDSLYQVLESRYGVRVVTADEVVEAGRARQREARWLGIAAGAPAFFFTRISYLQDGRPAEYVKSSYRADRYRLEIRLTRPEQ